MTNQCYFLAMFFSLKIKIEKKNRNAKYNFSTEEILHRTLIE